MTMQTIIWHPISEPPKESGSYLLYVPAELNGGYDIKAFGWFKTTTGWTHNFTDNATHWTEIPRPR